MTQQTESWECPSCGIKIVFNPGCFRCTIKFMELKNHPPIKNGSLVKTTQEDVEDSKSWSEEAKKARKWNVKGFVIGYHDSHGLCYDIRHSDDTIGCYNPTELEIM